MFFGDKLRKSLLFLKRYLLIFGGILNKSALFLLRKRKCRISTDIILALLVFIVCAYAASIYCCRYQRSYSMEHNHWYQHYFLPKIVAVMAGYPHGMPKDLNEKYNKFRKSCRIYDSKSINRSPLLIKDLPKKYHLDKSSSMSLGENFCNITFGVAYLWKFLKMLSWDHLAIFISILFGMAGSFAYLLFRTVSNHLISLVMTSFYMTAPVLLSYVKCIRDFSRIEGGLIVFIIVLFWLKHKLTWKNTISVSLLSGCFLGFAMGFRKDFTLFFPLMFLSVMFFGRDKWNKKWLYKFTYIVIFSVMFFVFSMHERIMMSYYPYTPHANEHLAAMGLGPTKEYNSGIMAYNYVFSNKGSDGDIIRITKLRYMAKNGEQLTKYTKKYGYQLYMAKPYSICAREMLLEYLFNFPCYFIKRGFSTLNKILQMPYTSFNFNPGLLLFIIALSIILTVNMKQAFFVLFSLIWTAGVYSLQVSPRHYFYLFCIGLLSAGYLCQLVYSLLRHRSIFLLQGKIKKAFKIKFSKRKFFYLFAFWVLICSFSFLSISISGWYQNQQLRNFALKLQKLKLEKVDYKIEYNQRFSYADPSGWHNKPIEGALIIIKDWDKIVKLGQSKLRENQYVIFEFDFNDSKDISDFKIMVAHNKHGRFAKMFRPQAGINYLLRSVSFSKKEKPLLVEDKIVKCLKSIYLVNYDDVKQFPFYIDNFWYTEDVEKSNFKPVFIGSLW